MKFQVKHRTSYAYDAPVQDSFNDAYLCPVSDDLQLCHAFRLEIEPRGASILRRLDFFTNQVHHFEIIDPHTRLDVTSHSTVETFPDTRDFSVDCDPAALEALSKAEWLYDFTHASERVPIPPMIIHEAKEIVEPGADVQRSVEQIMDFVHKHFTYKPGATLVETSLIEVFERRVGVCQDFAHVMIGLCRASKIPARYVSGYFYAASGSFNPIDDNTASHAWVDCYLPGIGWSGFDPTHNRRSSDIYIKVAVGRDYSDVRPLAGTYRGTAKAEMDVSVNIVRID
jgi:transglutaminase-like putative cysteine protease